VKKKVLLYGVALLVLLAIPVAVSADTASDDVDISGNLAGTISITVTENSGGFTLALSPGATDTNLGAGTVTIGSNSNWQVDIIEGTVLNNAVDGRMAQYDGAAYPVGGYVLSNNLQLKRSEDGIFSTLGVGGITNFMSGTSAETGGDFDIQQAVLLTGDQGLPSGHMYRMTIVFTASNV